MKIEVRQRFRPYSSLPGASCLVPGQEAVMQAYPSFSEVRTLNGELIFKKPGVDRLFQDLEKPFQSERLSFGCFKAQDVDKIRQRKDLKEILPLWLKLSTFYQPRETAEPGSLLYELVHETDKNRLAERFLNLYYAGFTPFFVPRKVDNEHHGFSLPPLGDEDPLILVTEGAKAIRRMVIEEDENIIRVLPCLPACFPSGRWIDFPLASGTISVEWTKGFLRRVLYSPYKEETPEIKFPKEVKRYRVKACGKSFAFDNFVG